MGACKIWNGMLILILLLSGILGGGQAVAGEAATQGAMLPEGQEMGPVAPGLESSPAGPELASQAGPDVPASSRWQIQGVDTPHRFKYMTPRSLIVDAQGHPHIAYGTDHLYYAWHDGATWQIEVVDSSPWVGQCASLALDAAGYPHISYRDTANATLKYAWYDGARWHTTTVDNSALIGWGATLVLDHSGRPHISYPALTPSENWDDLRYAYFDGSTWITETVDSNGQTGAYPSLALDSTDRPHITYYDTTSGYAFKYAYFDGSAWQIQTIESPVSSSEPSDSMVLDANDWPHMSYMGGSGTLRYTYFDGTSWHPETVDTLGSAGYGISLVLDTSGRPHIGYHKGSGGGMNYAYKEGMTWQITVVESGGYVGHHASLALDSTDEPRLSYCVLTNANDDCRYLKYAYHDGTGWHVEVADTGGRVGAHNSLVLDSQGWPHISYADWSGGSNTAKLKYTRYDGAAWQTETVDAGGTAGIYTSLALDQSDRPHITYYDQVAETLKYAHFDGTAWQIETVTSVGSAGCNSLVLDATGRPHVSYYSGGVLKYAYYDGAAWQTQSLDSNLGGFSGEISLLLDSLGRPHIAYYDSTTDQLKYVYYDGSTWHIELVNQLLSGTGSASMRFDSAGRPRLAYDDYGGRVVKYAYRNGGTWYTEVVDTSVSNSWPFHTSLALDSSDRPHISYLDVDTVALHYASFDGSSWQIEVVDSGGWTGFFSSIVLDSQDQAHISYYDNTGGDLKYASEQDCLPLDGAGIDGPRLLVTGESGIYTATFSPPTATLPILFSWSNGEVGPTAAYRWETPGTYSISVTASNCSTPTFTAFYTVTVRPCQPVSEVGFTWTPLTPTAGQVVTLTAVATGTLPITYNWDLGDGTRAAGRVVDHAFALPGAYTVTLAATNLCGPVVTATHVITVTTPPCQPFPWVDFAWWPLVPTATQPFTLSALAASFPPVTYTWDLGDGTVAAGQVIRHVYAETGTYTVTMTAINGCSQDSIAYTVSVASRPQPSRWTIERVDAPKLFSAMGNRSLALDSAGHPHVAYGRDFLYYAWHDGVAWHLETVDRTGNTGAVTSLALDAAGRPHISYEGLGMLKYAHYDGSAWQVVTVDNTGYAGGPTSLALDAAGRPHIGYIDSFHHALQYAYYDGTIWRVKAAVSGIGSGGHVSLALDSHDRPRMSYYDGNTRKLNYAFYDGTDWHVQTVDNTTGSGWYTSLVLDAADRPHISYGNSSSWLVMYAYYDGTGWQIQTVDDDGEYTSLALDADGQPHISYHYWNQEDLRYAHLDQGIWQIEAVDVNGSTGLYTSLALDDSGLPRIIYETWMPGVYGGRLQYAQWTGSSWQIEVVDREDSTGYEISLAVDGANRPHINYLDNYNGNLEYSYRDIAGWHLETVDGAGVGANTSLALDSAGWPHISYMDNINGDLKYAYLDGTSWHTETVDSAGYEGHWASLALDAQDRPHISYYENILGDGIRLKYAYWDGAMWQIEVLTSSVASLPDCSLALDSAGHPHIAFLGSLGNLRYASWDGAWSFETIDQGYVGYHVSLALDAAERPHIGYGSGSPTFILKHAYYDGTAWRIETVDNGGDVGDDPALFVDVAGHFYMSYCQYNVEHQHCDNLKYAYYDGSDWQIEIVDSAGDVGGQSSLAVDVLGQVHIGYYDQSNADLKYATGEAIPPCVPVPAVNFTWRPLTPIAGQVVALTAAATGTLPISYSWDLGDGTRAAGRVVDHAFALPGAYTVTLTATNRCGPVVTATHIITVVTPPCDPVTGVDFTWTPLTPTAGQVVTLTAAATGTLPISYSWDLGDGSRAAGRVVDHAFALPGAYTVTLTATNLCGPIVTATHVITVAMPPCDPVTGTDFTWMPTDPIAGQVVTFTGVATGTLPITYSWAFGDGGGASDVIATHTYTAPGLYLVTLTATNSCGRVQATGTVSVSAAVLAPIHVVALLAFDNDLAPYAAEVLDRFRLGSAANPQVHATLLLDGRGGDDSEVIVIAGGTVTHTHSIPWLPGVREIDSASGQVLADFLLWARGQYPEERTVVALLGHSIGLVPEVSLAPGIRSQLPLLPQFRDRTSGDVSSGTYLSTTELGRALAAATANGGEPFDLLFFDQCFQGNLDVLYEVRSSAQVIVTSPNYAWGAFAYDHYLPYMTAVATPEEMAQGILVGYEAALDDTHPNAIAWVHGADLAPLGMAASALGDALRGELGSNRGLILDATLASRFVDTTLCSADLELCPPDELVGLGSFARALQARFPVGSPVHTAAGDMLLRLTNVHNVFRTGHPWVKPEVTWAYTDTLTLLAPLTPTLDSVWRASIYTETAPLEAVWSPAPFWTVTIITQPALAVEGRWDNFLSAWYGPLTPTVTPFCRALPPALVYTGTDQLTLTVQPRLIGASLAWSANPRAFTYAVYVLRPDGTTWELLDVVAAPQNTYLHVEPLLPSGPYFYLIAARDAQGVVLALSRQAAAALGVTGLVPDRGYYGLPTRAVLSGNGFTLPMTLTLDGQIALPIEGITEQYITTTVPAGIATGSYSLVVTTEQGRTVLYGAFRVTEPVGRVYLPLVVRN